MNLTEAHQFLEVFPVKYLDWKADTNRFSPSVFAQAMEVIEVEIGEVDCFRQINDILKQDTVAVTAALLKEAVSSFHVLRLKQFCSDWANKITPPRISADQVVKSIDFLYPQLPNTIRTKEEVFPSVYGVSVYDYKKMVAELTPFIGNIRDIIISINEKVKITAVFAEAEEEQEVQLVRRGPKRL